ncbi:MAG: hypothetical protein KAX44_04080 [Candidatus Brocadiae bacterium]|nr:hypothetical protein [Candidatus Brocadiia bacterium]
MDRRSKFVWIMLGVLAVVLVLIGAVAVFIFSRLGQETGPVDLRLRLEPGKSYAFSVQRSAEVSSKTDGEREKGSHSLVHDYTFDVREVDEQGNAKISVTCDRFRMRDKGKDGETEYDSAADSAEGSESLKSRADMFDQSFSLTLSPRGRVLALDRVGEQYDQPLAEAEISAESVRLMVEQMDPRVGAQLVKALIEGSLAIYPEGPVQPGSRWQGEPLGEAVDGAVSPRSFQLKRRRKGIAIVTLRSEVPGTPSGIPGAEGMKMDVSSSEKGTLEIDEATGCIVRGETTEKFFFAFEMQGKRSVTSGKAWQKVTLVEK